MGRSLPVANALRRPNRQVRPASHGPKGVARTVVLACRLGCCLPVADAQHRPKWQRRPALDGAHRAPAPCLPLLPKKGDVCPPLGTAQNPLPQGLRNGNARITPKTQETSHFYDLCRCTNHFQSWKNRVVICTCVQIIEPA